MPLNALHQPAVATLVVTTVAVALSAAVTQTTMWWAGHDGGYLPALLAGAIPALMVPFTVYPLATANRRLRAVRIETLAGDHPSHRSLPAGADRGAAGDAG